MAAQVSQPATIGPGYAVIMVSGAGGFDPDKVEFSIEQPARGFLQRFDLSGPGWGTTHAWLKPEVAARENNALRLTLAPGHTWNLKANVTYLLHLRDGAGATPILERLAWRPLRMPSQPPEPLAELPPVPIPQIAAEAPPVEVAVAEYPAETIPAAADTVEPPVAVVPPATASQPGRRWLVLALIAFLLVGAGGAALWYAGILPPKPPAASPQPPVAAAPGPTTVAAAREFLRTSPDGKATFAEAERYMHAGTPDAVQGALILYAEAQRLGVAAGATAVGRMYDPDTYTPGSSAAAAPDAEKALLWYERGAAGNDADALYRAGKLLLSGRAEGDGKGPEVGVRYLERAKALGSAEAGAELAKLTPAQ